MTIARSQLVETGTPIPSQRPVTSNALAQQQALDAVDMPRALAHQNLTLPTETSAVFLFP
ncbi:hypothetical protein SXCC_00681 [Gluconacetobacter sp. SXCC-1]|nr:hypothetical protein SXCC_02851 [Gluconacetobacter sp. SXCC-1]EGG76758.1 hypothetical protein SXCC_02684 [Gluconacetobacter sp. SXCC-1]EGG77271.1 hypothetical protein SXCC_02484 [Gluconacetobacter sp. SXCC-1]EGG77918.1 hypothetical protein SXCC_01310 [Gluconacetobacter sp. SXCC-1]EGG78063.1 hypothetical protein SXCC_01457 [Gluconacetobacter sp. SXCC-1]